MERSDTPAPLTYRIQQMGPPRLRDGSVSTVHGQGIQHNEPVTGFDSLVLHHPGDNRAARMVDSAVIDGKPGRAFAHIDGRLQEVEYPRFVGKGVFRSYDLQPDQVLIKRDYILSRPGHDPMSSIGRAVAVPSPVDGVIGARRDAEGLIDIHDRAGGKVIARFRPLSDIQVRVGDTVSYGQTLGTQGKVATPAIHVHVEMDSHYYRQFGHYVDDLASGRLPMQEELRRGVAALPVPNDGTFRLGQASEQIRRLQAVMDGEGYRNADGSPLDRDGVYRIGMQGALLDFQRAHEIAQTGDVDRATLGFASPPKRFEFNRHHHTEFCRFPSRQAETAPLPGHPDHHDHRPYLPAELPPAVNQRSPQAMHKDDQLLDQLISALAHDDNSALSKASQDMAALPAARLLLEQGRELLAAEQLQQQHLQAHRIQH
jgi:peptidoglycan hydrolase-like protein with peptidoglycan-binding domain